MRNLTNCFYCQGLKSQQFTGSGKCAFCGVVNNPLYLIIYEKKPRYFCCGCAWWQFPRSGKEKVAEAQWYQEWRSFKAKNQPIF